MPFVPKPQFPNVPQLPGVPQLARSPLFPAGPPPALSGIIALGRLALAITTKPQWGIYKIDTSPPSIPAGVDDATGLEILEEVTIRPETPALVPTSILRLDYDQAWVVTDAPVQLGGFASYNKVATPFETVLRMTKGGSLAERQEFLDKAEQIGASLDLYRILTPERVYMNCNITSVRVLRDGAASAYFLAEVDITFREIRIVSSEYTSSASDTQAAKNPSARPVSNQGTLNAIPPTSRLQGAIDSVLTPLRQLGGLLGAG